MDQCSSLTIPILRQLQVRSITLHNRVDISPPLHPDELTHAISTTKRHDRRGRRISRRTTYQCRHPDAQRKVRFIVATTLNVGDVVELEITNRISSSIISIWFS
jgi:hypothetical protein